MSRYFTHRVCTRVYAVRHSPSPLFTLATMVSGVSRILYRAFSRDVTRTKLIKNGRHFGVQHRFLEKLACLSMEPRSYIEALGAELVGKEDEWTN